MHQQLWGYKVGEKLYAGGGGGTRKNSLNTTVISNFVFGSFAKGEKGCDCATLNVWTNRTYWKHEANYVLMTPLGLPWQSRGDWSTS
jgi:hypothetical protein